ncbi:hypothetical protein DPMN_062983 [Dreissena polymorpha]|uniref:Uncharacterized protein n=1 Tax=Dreissena polymorpha TaxID=45954 RepID=A0A9D4CAN9_DREPO|nr:hypothetical protein DPMN_062983 [Dreissena polymorpha]
MPHWMELGCNRLTDIKLVPCIGHNNNIRSMQHWIELGCNLHTDIKWSTIITSEACHTGGSWGATSAQTLNCFPAFSPN